MPFIVPSSPVATPPVDRERGRDRSATFFAEYFPPYMGSDRRIFDLARSIADWHVEFAVTPPLRILGGRQEAALHDYFQRHFIDGIVEDESGGIHGHYFLLPGWLMNLWQRVPMPFSYAITVPYLVARAVKYLRDRKPDVVVVGHPSYLCGIVALIAAKIVRIPTLLDYPDAWTPLAIETALIDKQGMVARILGELERFAAQRADRIVSITHGLTGYIRRMGARQPIDIVSNGADFTRFDTETVKPIRDQLGVPADRTIVLYSGRLESWSGVSELVETIRRTRAAAPGIHFLFVGDGSASCALKREISEAHLDDAVTCLGVRPYSQMPSIVASVDLAIVPFPHTPTTEFCSPVKLFEYMMMGKALITTDLPGIRESVSEEHVTFVSDLSAEQLATAIVELARDPRRCAAQAEASIRHAKAHFSYTELAKKFSASMRAVAESPELLRR